MEALTTLETIYPGIDFQKEYTVTKAGQDVPNFMEFTPSATLWTVKDEFVANMEATITDSRTVLVAVTSAQNAGFSTSKTPTHYFHVEIVSPGGIVYLIGIGIVTIKK
jgi:hypothetical protein